MPKQIGTHRVLGTTGNMTYTKTQDGFEAREKTVVSKDKIKNSPSYEAVRQNNAHFAEAGKGVKLLRSAFIGLVKSGSDGRITGRLNALFYKVVNTDATSKRGERKISKGDLQLLKGFEFNVGLSLTSALHMPYAIAFDRVSGLYTVTISPEPSGINVTMPPGATHFRVVSGVAEVDFNNQTSVSSVQSSADIEADADLSQGITLSLKATPQSSLPQLLVLGIRFLRQELGKMYLMPKDMNASALVQVNTVS